MELTRYEQKHLERLAAVMATVELIPECDFAIVPSTTKKSTLYYVSHDGARSTGCDCTASQNNTDCIHRLAVDRRLEQAREAAQEQALWDAAEPELLRGIDQYLAEQSPIDRWVAQGVDPEVAKRVARAKPAKSTAKGQLSSSRAFSLMR